MPCGQLSFDTLTNIEIHISHVRSATFFRLELSQILNDVDKCIYLDVDTVVCQDLSELFRLNIDDKYIAGVRAAAYYYPKYRAGKKCSTLGISDISFYVNAGVLVMNLKKMRENKLAEVFKDLVKKDFPAMDQDILNAACYGNIMILPPKYNAMTKYALLDDSAYTANRQLQLAYSVEEWDSARKYPIVIHYADKTKPWLDLTVDFSEKWWKVASLLPFFTEIYRVYSESFFNAMKTYTESLRELQSNIQFWKKYSMARIDIKNTGAGENDVFVIENTDDSSLIQTPGWIKNEQGNGIVVTSARGHIGLSIKCIGGGKLNIWLRGIDYRDENNVRIPIYVDFTYLIINKKKIFDSSCIIWHDKPYLYGMEVNDGQIVDIRTMWKPAIEALHKERSVKSETFDVFSQKELQIKP